MINFQLYVYYGMIDFENGLYYDVSGVAIAVAGSVCVL
jgi:hypothetical protein